MVARFHQWRVETVEKMNKRRMSVSSGDLVVGIGENMSRGGEETV